MRSKSALLTTTLLSSSCNVAAFAWNTRSHSERRGPSISLRCHSNLSVRLSVGRLIAANHGALLYLSSSSDDDATTDSINESSEPCNAITDEMEQLQQQLTYIEALEERNKAQLDSFVDEQDQWDSMEEEERQLLQNKADIEKRLEQITSELVNMW
eukprot:CAMPEP_0197718740 /NCGR_PEP_ID=MMETSP1434-20131217/2774_1 /TAXON_ID=265543 /ORGANISM="Minutocellus polymorphus, Strain CCMP3303" /LENGTH=155 /DNA_ID=CAMNT_0043303421 /DNA_START=94 /DNA_END=558 /DNA_ORIENTATION=-